MFYGYGALGDCCAGSAGCTLAERLCEDSDLRVLLIESGGHGQSVFIRIPAGNGILIGNPKYDQGADIRTPGRLHGGTIYYPRGSGLGGSSLLNGMSTFTATGQTAVIKVPTDLMPGYAGSRRP
ncbi:MAG: hypothetical protein F4Z52_03460 [Gammaproteobacteria bacterium]|nr:hypothetical protein [Gammaproteobacteria bacterium]MXY65505.1 hypothetical protein [Gammaproteobacteria bacterium]MYG66018.1 hypothetical protein [Gammaproteobacteria bacterium]